MIFAITEPNLAFTRSRTSDVRHRSYRVWLFRLRAPHGFTSPTLKGGTTSAGFSRTPFDWGELCQRDRQENECGLERDHPPFSAYRIHADDELWAVTDRQFSKTTTLLPEEC